MNWGWVMGLALALLIIIAFNSERSADSLHKIEQDISYIHDVVWNSRQGAL